MFNRETQKNWMKSQVAHSLRGRLRLRVEGLNFLNDEKEEIAQMLANLPGVQCVQVTPITCGILRASIRPRRIRRFSVKAWT